MALYTPVIVKLNSIIVSGLYVQPTTFPFYMEFVVSGGNKPTNYEVKITSLTSSSSSYTYSGTYNQSPQVVSFDAKDKIPVRSDIWSCQVRTSNASETSEWSIAKTFYTGREPYFRPSFVASDLADFNGPTQTVRLVYDTGQTEIQQTGETQILDSYILNLYDVKADKIVDTSGIQYTYLVNMEPNEEVSYEYTFFGLEQGRTYSVEAIGNTSFNLTFSQRSQKNITISYPIEDDSLLFLENNCEQGFIHVESPLKNIQPSISTFPDAGFTSDNGYYPGYNSETNKYGFTTWSGFNSKDDFTLQVDGRDFKQVGKNYDNIKLQGKYDAETEAYPELTLNYKEDINEGIAWIECRLDIFHVTYGETSKKHSYIAYSNSISRPLSFEDLNIWVRYVNGLLDIVLTKKEG